MGKRKPGGIRKTAAKGNTEHNRHRAINSAKAELISALITALITGPDILADYSRGDPRGKVLKVQEPLWKTYSRLRRQVLPAEKKDSLS